jgi:glycosyltransferase involved in cell wall biosynthesis
MEQKNKFNLPYAVVFITAYNEEGAIRQTIEAIRAELSKEKYSSLFFDIIMVDDGSTDDTAAIARASGAKVISHPRNRGLGAATRTGMQTAYEMGADIAIKADGDAQFLMDDLEKLIAPIMEERADVVFGSRFLGHIRYDMPAWRSRGNAFFSWFAGYLTGMEVTDSATGLISFSRRYLSRFNILMDYNETQQLIIDSWGKGMRVVEVPIDTKPRTTGRSFINWKYPLRVLPAIVRSYIHAKPLKAFFWVGFATFILGIAIGFLWFFKLSAFFGGLSSTVLIITGIQIILFGFLADIVVKKR